MKIKNYNIVKLILVLLELFSVHANYDKYYLDDSEFCRRSGASILIGHLIHKSTIVISAVQPSDSYRSSLKCSVTVRAPNGFGIIANKRMVNLRNETIVESHSSRRRQQTSVQLSDKLILSLDQNSVKYFNAIDLDQDVYVSDKNEVLLTFLTSSSKSSSFGKNFEIIFTAFSIADSSGQCIDQNDWFNCGDNRCVQKSLICDNISNCVTNEDESERLCGKWCMKNKELFWTLFVIGWAISTFFIILTLIVCLIYRRLCFVICF